MKEKDIDILIACDLNPSRPWFRDRIPAIKDVIKNYKAKIIIKDIYELLNPIDGYNPSDSKKRRNFFQTADLIKINLNIIENILKINPKNLLIGTVDNYIEFLLPSTIRLIQDKGIYVAGILGDDEFRININKYFLPIFDLSIVYVKNIQMIYESFQNKPVYYLPNSCYLNKSWDSISRKSIFDVIIIGAPFANRPKHIKSLINSGLKVAIYGSKNWLKYDFCRKYYKGFVSSEDFDTVLSSGKIVLAFLENNTDYGLHMNTKIWEAVRVGRLPICTYYEPLFSAYKLKEGESIVTYKNTRQLVKKAIYYSSQDNDREYIARNLYNLVKENFNYSKEYKKLFDYLLGEKVLNNQYNKKYKKYKISNHEIFTINNFYFGNKQNLIDESIKSILEISRINKNLVFIYVYKIEENKLIKVRFPFIDFNSVFFTRKYKNRFTFLYFFIFGIISRNYECIPIPLVLIKKSTINGKINSILNKFYPILRQKILRNFSF